MPLQVAIGETASYSVYDGQVGRPSLFQRSNGEGESYAPRAVWSPTWKNGASSGMLYTTVGIRLPSFSRATLVFQVLSSDGMCD